MISRLVILFALIYFPANAQIQFNSIEEVLNYADAHAAAIRSAAISEQIAQAEKKEANSYLFPTLNSSLGYNDNIKLQPVLLPAQVINPGAPEGEFEQLTFGTRYLYNIGLQAQWDVLNFQKIFATQTANLKVEESRLTTEISRFNTYNQLASTYYSILLTQEAIDIYGENARVSTDILEHANEKYENGIISEAERNQAEIKKLQSQQSLNLAENNLKQLYIQLQSQLNTNEPITISDSPEHFALEDTAIRNPHPEVMLEAVKLDKYESLLKQQKAQRLPSLGLYYQANQNWATNDFMNFSESQTLPQQAFGVTLSFTGILSPTTTQKIKQSKWKLELQQQQLQNTKLVTQKEDEILKLQFEQAFNQLAENKQILSLQEANDVHVENQYRSGIISLDMRLNKYDDLLEVQDRYLQSLAEYTLAQYQIYIRQFDFEPVKAN